MAGKFGKCLMGMNYVLGDVPVTVKMRTGVKDGMPTVHKLMLRLHDWGVSSVAVGHPIPRDVGILFSDHLADTR